MTKYKSFVITFGILIVMFWFDVASAQSSIPIIPREPVLAGTLPKAATIVMSTALVLSAVSFLLQPLYYILALLPLLFYRRSNSGWGIVFNSVTKMPVSLAKVILFKKYRGQNKFKDSQITTSGGRFGFIVEPGEYYIRVTAKNFDYPSTKIAGQDPYYKHPYHGEPIIKVGKDQLIDINIPIDPKLEANPPMLSLLKTFFEKIRIPILLVGTAFSLYLAFLFPEFYNFLFLLIYVLIWVVEFWNISKKRQVCYVQRSDDRIGINNAVIKIYNDSNKLERTLMSDPFGNFLPILEPGKYRLKVSHDGYQTTETNLHVDKNGITKSSTVHMTRLKKSN